MATCDTSTTTSTTSSSVSNVCGGTSRSSTVSTVVTDGLALGGSTTNFTALCQDLSRTLVFNGNVPAGKYYLFFTAEAITMNEIRVVVENSTGACFKWNLRHSLNYSGLGTQLFAGDVDSTSTGLGNSYPSEVAFVSAATSIPSASHVWIEVTQMELTDFAAMTFIYQPPCAVQSDDIDNPVLTQTFDGQAGLLGLNPPTEDLSLFQ